MLFSHTHPNYQWSSYTMAMYPLTVSKGMVWLCLLLCATAITEPSWALEYFFAIKVVLEIGRNAWYWPVPTAVLVLSHLNFRWHLVCTASLLHTYCTCMDGKCSFDHEYSCAGVNIWWCCKLERAARRLLVLPTPSHGPLQCDVAKKCHSAFIPKSVLWWHKLMKLFLFLYCGDAPSEK
jgi:hypothetical protein